MKKTLSIVSFILQTVLQKDNGTKQNQTLLGAKNGNDDNKLSWHLPELWNSVHLSCKQLLHILIPGDFSVQSTFSIAVFSTGAVW